MGKDLKPGSLQPFVLAACLVGCSRGASDASINDLGSGDARIVAVDNQPVKRAQHPIITVIPVARVRAGAHVLALRTAPVTSRESADTLLVPVVVESGKRYRLERRGDSVLLFEDPQSR